MDLQHINLTDLTVSATNVRKHGKASIAKSSGDLIPSIRSLGVLQPLLVRRSDEGFEVVAGQRRFLACQALAAEDRSFAELPCIVMEDGDDAAAIEASLAENLARLPMDEVDQYKAFAALAKTGLDTEDIAARFGVTERLITQRLAIGNLIGPVLTAYRKDEIDAGTLRTLTLATKAQQKRWLELLRSDEHYAPTGRALKHWLFGGATILVRNAMFNVAGHRLATIGDLFGEDEYIADSEAFWPLQSAAVAELAEQHRAEGWAEVVVHEPGHHWQSWNYAEMSKKEGGAVHITIANDGEVTIHAGVLHRDHLRKRQEAEETGEAAPVRPEITKAMQRYLDLHRHAAVRANLLGHPGIGLRLAVAQMIAGSTLWSVKAEGQKAPTEAIGDSLAANKAEDAFAEERAEIAKLLGIETNGSVVRDGWQDTRDLHAIFAKLTTLDDERVTRILTFVVAETLAAGTPMIDALGIRMGTDMADHWTPDETFFDLLRDKEAIGAMLREIGGKRVAGANATETAKTQKEIIRAFLSGERTGGTDDWQPRYMAFPMQAYTKRGGIPAIDDWKRVKSHHA